MTTRRLRGRWAAVPGIVGAVIGALIGPIVFPSVAVIDGKQVSLAQSPLETAAFLVVGALAGLLLTEAVFFLPALVRATTEQRNELIRRHSDDQDTIDKLRKAARRAAATGPHLEVQREFAREARDMLRPSGRFGRAESTTPLDLSPVGLSDFGCHFPGAAGLLVEWNRSADGYQSIGRRLPVRLQQEGSRLGIDATAGGLAGLLMGIAGLTIAPSDITFDNSDGPLRALWQTSTNNGQFTIASVAQIETAGGLDVLIGEVIACMAATPNYPEVTESRWYADELPRVRQRCEDALERAIRSEELTGDCDTFRISDVEGT